MRYNRKTKFKLRHCRNQLYLGLKRISVRFLEKEGMTHHVHEDNADETNKEEEEEGTESAIAV